MVKALMKLADRAVGALLPEVKASANCTPRTIYTDCHCADRGNGTGGYYCNVTYVYGNCASSAQNNVEVGSC